MLFMCTFLYIIIHIKIVCSEIVSYNRMALWDKNIPCAILSSLLISYGINKREIIKCLLLKFESELWKDALLSFFATSKCFSATWAAITIT